MVCWRKINAKFLGLARLGDAIQVMHFVFGDYYGVLSVKMNALKIEKFTSQV